LTGKFLAGTNPRKSAFPKGKEIRDQAAMGPGPGSYQPIMSMGKQVLSTKTGSIQLVFPKGSRLLHYCTTVYICVFIRMCIVELVRAA
jgi:hypothetical protein